MRKALGIALVITAGWGAAGLVACTTDWWGDGAVPGSNCPIDATQECCPCSLPEDCPQGEPPIPPYCDGGLDTRTDAGKGAPLLHCSGQCVPQAPPSWLGPELLYEGSAVFAPACPSDAPLISFEGVSGPEALPRTCSGCVCDPPIGACDLAKTWTVSSVPCSDPSGGVKTNFDPPMEWDGACTAGDIIQPGKLCGGKPCVASITILPPIVEESPCQPRSLDPWPSVPKLHDPIPMPDDTLGRACTAPEPWPLCEEKEEEGKACLPQAGPGFAVCVHKEGDESCPEGFPVRSFLYGEVDDQGSCPPCGCEPPSGGECILRAILASDPACTVMPTDIYVTTGMPFGCQDLPVGMGLGSKSAEIYSYERGSCKPTGGSMTGTLGLSKPTTFCCLAKP